MFLGSFVAGTLFNEVQQWIKNPMEAVSILGTSAPLTSIFFTQYIMTQVPPRSPSQNRTAVIRPVQARRRETISQMTGGGEGRGQTFMSSPGGNLKTWSVLAYVAKTALAATRRAKNRLWSESFLMYGTQVPKSTIVILLGMAFATIMPLIGPMSLLYFIMTWYTAK